MQEKISATFRGFETDMASVKDLKSLEELRIKYFSRNGHISLLFEDFKNLPKEEKPKWGQLLNQLKNDSQSKFDSLKLSIESATTENKERIDLSLPGRKRTLGSKHLITQTMDEIKSIFQGLGFSVHEGPELESDYYNFEALNFPDDHPARDMQDTFFINKDFLMRTHTTPIQVRLFETKGLPIRAIMPGRVYRNEVLSYKHYCVFYQIDGIYVDKNVTFAELKGTLVSFVKTLYGSDVKYRFRASFFPFTEPSAEMDIWWEPKGKPGRWMEILGCGMIDPNVLKNAGIDPDIYSGYAFGMGVERQALRKYNIPDIRILFDNDKRFLTQF
jgi:phenylalanyl-tRNA synthetase alpha chain